MKNKFYEHPNFTPLHTLPAHYADLESEAFSRDCWFTLNIDAHPIFLSNFLLAQSRSHDLPPLSLVPLSFLSPFCLASADCNCCLHLVLWIYIQISKLISWKQLWIEISVIFKISQKIKFNWSTEHVTNDFNY